MNARLRIVTMLLISTAMLVALGTLLLWLPDAVAADSTSVAGPPAPEALKWAYIAAALSTGLSALDAAYAVTNVGAAAIGALAENPELFGRLIILVGLSEGIAIYGLIISVLILNSLT